MIVIALLLLAVAIALIVAALIGQSAEVTVDFFDVSIATDTAEVFLAGVLTGVIGLLALVLLRTALRRSRQRREEVRELRRRARTVPDREDEAAAQRYDDEVDDVTMTKTRDYPTEEQRN
jgi:flagellar biosynthesis/type III secretory pathway M-ring protein FliF/YscJ